MLHKNRKRAFTLAETLITLGIIGIVAAMTIPVLMTKYRMHIVETRLSRTYSIVTQAIKIAEENYGEGFGVDMLKADTSISEAGDVNGYSWELSQAAFDTFFKQGIKTIHSYPKEYSKDFKIYYGTAARAESLFAWYDLLDGTRLGFCMRGGNLTGIMFYIIPCPNKNKIRSGVDAFFIEFKPLNGSYEYYPLWYQHYKNKVTKEKLIEYCGSDKQFPAYATTAASFCFELLKQNGWKIPADYPLKF